MDIVDPNVHCAEEKDNGTLFQDYFARFKDIQEVPFLQMEFPTNTSASQHARGPIAEPIEPMLIQSQQPRPDNEELNKRDAWISQYRLDLEDQISDSSDRNEACVEMEPLGDPLILYQDSNHTFSRNTDEPSTLLDSDQTSHFHGWQPEQHNGSTINSSDGSSTDDGQIPQQDWTATSIDLFLSDPSWDIEAALFPTPTL